LWFFPQACAWGYRLMPAARAFGVSVRMRSESIPDNRLDRQAERQLQVSPLVAEGGSVEMTGAIFGELWFSIPGLRIETLRLGSGQALGRPGTWLLTQD
jgi:hypothetical protein